MRLCFNKTVVFAIGLISITQSARGEVCDWAKTTPPDDAQYKYFVSRQFSTASREDAKRRVEDDITQKVCNVLGNFLSSASDSYEDENIANSTSSTAQRSRCLGVYKQNFEQLQTDDGKVDGEYVACAKYRYAKKDLLQEQERLKKEGPTSGSLALSLYVGDAECEGQPLEIRTNPGGAYVSIDDRPEYSGVSPLRFGNVCTGKHDLTITLQNYVPVSETIRISSKAQNISKKLERATKKVKVTTNLGTSTITISDQDGFKQKSGKEPLTYSFYHGIPYTLLAENDVSDSVSITKTFNEQSLGGYKINLKKLDGYIDFTVFKRRNPGVKIFVNGTEVISDKTGPLTPDKKHTVTFKKPGGYGTIKKSVYVNANKTENYPSDELKFDSTNVVYDQYDTLDELSNLWVGVGWGMGTYANDYIKVPTRSLTVNTNLFLTKRFSLDFDLAVGTLKTSAEYGSSTYRDYLYNSNAAALFPNQDAYATFEAEQMFVRLHGGISWYLTQSFMWSPFVTVGYDKFISSEPKFTKLDSNFLSEDMLMEIVEMDSGAITAGAGVQIGILRVVGTYSPNYYGFAINLTFPM